MRNKNDYLRCLSLEKRLLCFEVIVQAALSKLNEICKFTVASYIMNQ